MSRGGGTDSSGASKAVDHNSDYCSSIKDMTLSKPRWLRVVPICRGWRQRGNQHLFAEEMSLCAPAQFHGWLLVDKVSWKTAEALTQRISGSILLLVCCTWKEKAEGVTPSFRTAASFQCGVEDRT